VTITAQRGAYKSNKIAVFFVNATQDLSAFSQLPVPKTGCFK